MALADPSPTLERAPRVPSVAAFRSGLALVLALAALPFSKLALPAGLIVFLCFLAAPTEPAEVKKRHRIALGIAAAAAAIAVPNFLIREAMPGLVQGGTMAAGARAVSRLREILFAEDGARRSASWDPDGDGVGSALLLGELTGELGMRGQARVSPPLLERYPKVEATSDTSFLEIGGFLFSVCLPTAQGFSSDPHATFDDEQAERRFVAYAWPSGRGPGLDRAYFIDEHERILSAPVEDTQRFGREHPPRCDDAIAPATRDDWHAWRGKKPRATLAGDKTPGG
ncbi:MAG TPA: hypothetical protein VGQ57_22005 [Polyangiaceae bacterium]|nr:hypothetical protein [Polyangiaceae bacterium]